MDFYTIHIEEGQSIWDIAIQEYGDPMEAWTILEDNPATLTDLNTDLTPAMLLKIRVDHPVSDRELMKYFREQKIYVNCKD